MIFYKYSCLGNDFILLLNQRISTDDIRPLLSPHIGVGGDGIIFLDTSDRTHINLTIYNADGSKAKMCGNALKIVAYHLNVLYNDIKFNVFIDENKYEIGKNEDRFYCVVPKARFKKRQGDYFLYSVRNYHALKFVDNLDESTILSDGPLFNGYNITHIKLISSYEIETLTYENGVGFTLSCGSAAISVFTLLLNLNMVSNKIKLNSRGGSCVLVNDDTNIINCSDVKFIYKGELLWIKTF